MAPSFLPYTRLFLHVGHSVALTANGHILVLDSLSGALLHSTADNPDYTEKVDRSGALVAANVDDNFKYLVTATSDKCIRVWEITSLHVVMMGTIEAPKKPTDVCFSRDAQTILVSDKFGDVHSYPLNNTADNEDLDVKLDHDQPKAKNISRRTTNGSLLLGHVSLLTTFLLTKNEKYIITADRDEHIRVSWYPEAYTIERYCLGHKKFVSALHIPSWNPSLLISGGGDPVLKIWDWMTGTIICEVVIADAVMSFIKVKRKKAGRDKTGNDEDGGDETKGLSPRQKGKGKRKRKGDEDGSPGVIGGTNEKGQNMMDVNNPKAREEELETSSSQVQPLLAVQRIGTYTFGSRNFIVFIAYGATSLFYFQCPESQNPKPLIKSVDLGQPVLDFVGSSNSDEIWILVDGNWSDNEQLHQHDPMFVRVVKALGDNLVLSDTGPCQPLLTSLNKTNRIEVSNEMLKSIDLYSALMILPKNTDVESNAAGEEALFSDVAGSKLSGKELGRLKSKKAVMARQADVTNKREQGETSEEAKILKRQKSEAGADRCFE